MANTRFNRAVRYQGLITVSKVPVPSAKAFPFSEASRCDAAPKRAQNVLALSRSVRPWASVPWYRIFPDAEAERTISHESPRAAVRTSRAGCSSAGRSADVTSAVVVSDVPCDVAAGAVVGVVGAADVDTVAFRGWVVEGRVCWAMINAMSAASTQTPSANRAHSRAVEGTH
jgi:hypothetical protein